MPQPICAECGATIMFAITPRNKWMPLDPDPNPAGNVIITRLDFYANRHCRVLKQDEDSALPRYMPHPATCPRRR